MIIRLEQVFWKRWLWNADTRENENEVIKKPRGYELVYRMMLGILSTKCDTIQR